MKKLLSGLLCLTLLLGTFVGCNRIPKIPIEIISTKTEYPTDVEKIECEVIINSKDGYSIENSFELLIKMEDHFVSYNYKSGNILEDKNTIEFTKESSGTTLTYNIKKYYDLPLEEGIYKIEMFSSSGYLVYTNEFTIK